MIKPRAKTGVKNAARVIPDKRELLFVGSISNLTGGFDLYEAGSVRRIQRNIKRENFTKWYLEDLGALFNLTNGQKILLNYMLGQKQFFNVFEWDENMKVRIAAATKFSVSHIENTFWKFTTKKLFVKIKMMHYRFNTEFVFAPNEVANADFLGYHLTYVFDDEKEAVIVKDKSKITMDDINAMIEIYKKQEEREKQINELHPTIISDPSGLYKEHIYTPDGTHHERS